MKGGVKINVYIQDKYAVLEEFHSDSFMVYLGLREIIRQDTDTYFISLGYLSFLLVGKQVASQLVTSSILSGIAKILKDNPDMYVEKKRANDWTLNLSKFKIEKDSKKYYTVINSDYIVKILNSNLKEKIELLRFYCYIMTTLSKTGDKVGVGFTSYENMDTATGICRQTISKYMDKLEQLNIIYIYRSSDSIKIDNMIREIPNVYGDINNKDKIKIVGSEHEDNYGLNKKRIKKNKEKSSRSASAKFNIMLNDLNTTGEIRYTNAECKEIYETLVKYNEKYSYDEGLQKDLSIFSNFDFY